MDETFWKAMAATIARKIMFGIATYLTTKGLLASGDQGQFINMGVGILIGVAALGWDWWKNVGHAKLQARVAALQGVAKTQAQAPSGPNVARVLVPLAILVLGLSLLASPAFAGAKKKPALTGNLKRDFQNAITPSPSAAPPPADNKILAALAKPFQDLANFIANDASGAAQLSVAIPEIQDGNGLACWNAMQVAGKVFKAHPVPLTFHAMSDFENLRLIVIATRRLCDNSQCGIIFNDGVNIATTAAPLTIPAPPVLQALCSKVATIQVVPPTPSDLAAVTPAAPAASNAPGTSAATPPTAPAAAPTSSPATAPASPNP